MKTHDRNWRTFEYQGKVRNLTEIARMVGMKPVTLNMRITRGMSLEDALSTPVATRNRRDW